MPRLACEFCGSKTAVRACHSCGALMCDDCAATEGNKVCCRDCLTQSAPEEEELEEAEEMGLQ